MSVRKERSYRSATASTSSLVPRLITAVLYERAARQERARPPDEHLHRRRRQGTNELNSVVGWCAAGLDRIQNELFDLGADLSVPYVDGDTKLRITQEAIDRLEQECDDANAALPELKSFVLPGGDETAARLFLARSVCRRAERTVLACGDMNPLAAVYLNRLSDLLFILARAANASAGVDEPLWRPGS